MNDRFKFRGYWYNDVQKEWWVYDEPEFITANGTVEIWRDAEGGAYPELPSNAELHLCQCTGLKDKNGKLIYDGYIVKIKNEIFFIKYEIGSFLIIRNQQAINVWYEMFPEAWNDDVYPLSQLYFEYDNEDNCIWDCEIIGNIYENPELLKECE